MWLTGCTGILRCGLPVTGKHVAVAAGGRDTRETIMTRVVTLFAALVLVSGCATMSVGSYANRYANFSGYSTYDWQAPDALPTGDPRLDNNRIFEDYFEGAVEKRLSAKGFQKPASGVPDLLLHYHTGVVQRIDVATIDRMYRQCNDEGCRTEVSDYDEITILLDAVEAGTEKLVWRGWARTNLNGIAEDQDRLENMVEKAVQRMLQGFPPASRHSLVMPPLATVRPYADGR
jgi:hypothetical protein